MHKSVLLEESINSLNIKEDGVYVDATLGYGGHSGEILKRLKKGKLFAFDQDEYAINYCMDKFKDNGNIEIIKSNFSNMLDELSKRGINKVDGILFDLGVSSVQLDQEERGFSFHKDAKLDMRMDTSKSFSAYNVVNEYSYNDLVRIFREYGEEKYSTSVANKIIKYRENKPIETTFELKDIIEKSFPKKVIYGKGGVSKQTFQAIRIEVNQELEGLKTCIESLIKFLKPGGRFAIISFHSLEDRIVKNTFKDACTGCICPPKTPVCICGHHAVAKAITRKPIIASQEELNYNSRASSAKLRIIEKL